MYERNAIVLERYFNQMFGYDMKYNIKTNFNEYCELVECLEKYKNVSDEEEAILEEYDSIANKIREIQKIQELLNKKNNKLQEERNNIFQIIGENSDTIKKKLDDINISIEKINEEIKNNANEFVDITRKFNDKTNIRTNCERTRRIVENDYNKKINRTLDSYKEIDINYEKSAKQFLDMETENIEKELNERIEKNGQKEKIPFDSNVIKEAINISIDIQKRETAILANIYEKMNRLFTEIKNNTTKIEKHKKVIKDSKCKLDFISAIKDYLVQFLDNERLTAVNGAEEHTNLMKEACKSFYEDLEQINNLYTLLLKEISKKVTKKSYAELYNLDYLKLLEQKAEEFDKEIKKLNLPVTVINPNHWRIEGMRKIYNIFYKCVTEEYGRDLSEYFITEDEFDEEEDNDNEESIELIEDNTNVQEEKQTKNVKQRKDDAKTDIDKKIDMILGINKDYNVWNKNEEDSEDNWEEDDNLTDDKEDDDWGDELIEDESSDLEDDNENNDEENEDENEKEEDDHEWEKSYENDETDDEDDWNSINIKKDMTEKEEDNWSNEFIRMDKPKKKISIFNKLKKQMDKN